VSYRLLEHALQMRMISTDDDTFRACKCRLTSSRAEETLDAAATQTTRAAAGFPPSTRTWIAPRSTRASSRLSTESQLTSICPRYAKGLHGGDSRTCDLGLCAMHCAKSDSWWWRCGERKGAGCFASLSRMMGFSSWFVRL
jgi:hypothetical protein